MAENKQGKAQAKEAGTQVEQTTVKPDTEHVAAGEIVHATSTMSVSVGNNDDGPNTVKVVIKYPKDYSGAKYMSEGEREVSAELADKFVNEMKIASYA